MILKRHQDETPKSLKLPTFSSTYLAQHVFSFLLQKVKNYSVAPDAFTEKWETTKDSPSATRLVYLLAWNKISESKVLGLPDFALSLRYWTICFL